MNPQYEYGERVRVIRNVRNDGTFPGLPTGTPLIRRGSVGYVKDVGTFLQDRIVYSVHFLDDDKIVGCLEEELIPADAEWIESLYEVREKVRAKLALGSKGKVLVEAGGVGQVLRVLRGADTGVQYQVLFPGPLTLQIPESALESAEEQQETTSSAVDAD